MATYDVKKKTKNNLDHQRVVLDQESLHELSKEKRCTVFLGISS